MTDVIGAWKVHCSRGPRIIRRGSQWRDTLTGSTWEVVQPSGTSIYSPSGFGGTPGFWCKPVGELTEAAKLWPAREDGCVEFCGDSIAAGLLDGALADTRDVLSRAFVVPASFDGSAIGGVEGAYLGAYDEPHQESK